MISVIVPIYKVEPYIDKCIKSVLTQSYEEFELILVDDGSPDECGKICDKYAIEDNRVKVIHKKNGGLSSARNAGLDIASGRYVFFLDGDDTLAENALQILHDAICDSGADVVFPGYNAVDENDNILHTSIPDEKIIADERKYTIVYEQTQLVMAATKLYKKEVFDKLRFREGKVHEDVFMYHEMVFNAKSIYCIPFAAINYLQRVDSTTGKKFSVRNFDAVEALFERVEFFEKINLLYSRNATISFIYKYLLMIIFSIDLSNPEFRNKFIEYYKKWKQFGYCNKDFEFKVIYLLYRLRFLRKPFAVTKFYRIAHIIKKVIASRKILTKVIAGNLCKKNNAVFISIHSQKSEVACEAYDFSNDFDIKNIIEIKSEDYMRCWSVIKRIIQKRDVVVINGGSVGTLQPAEADAIKKIVKDLKNNKIIIFPESIYFSSDFTGKLEYKLTSETFNLHNNLIMVTRDNSSYEAIKEMFSDIMLNENVRRL